MPRRAKPAVHVALMRGINVGGKNRLPMKPLAQLFADAGCAPVRTYIQSGNVVFGAAAKVVRTLPATISAAIERDHGLSVPLVLRSLAQLADVAANCPFDTDAVEHKHLHVAFLRDKPTAARVGALDPDRSPPDRFVVRGQDVYLCYPGGSARSKLDAAYLDRTLDTISTFRNWRTVGKIIDIGRELEAELGG